MSADSTPTAMLVGVEGLALLRGLHDRPGDGPRRLAEVRELLDDATGTAGAAPVESPATAGYAVWSTDYDGASNPIIDLEQPIVRAMIADVDGAAPARALDAACGTGRHTRTLTESGWATTGVDLTPEMLALARDAVPEATFVEGDLTGLPIDDASVGLVVCGLALGHLPRLAPAIAEFARVLVPGGEAILSTLHPLQIQLGWHALFSHPDGTRGFVREHPHTHADYLAAFRESGLELRDCVEPALGPAQIRARRRIFTAIPDACAQAYEGLPGVLVWRVRRRV